MDSYNFSESFQIKLLSLFLKQPERFYELVEPQFFTSPILMEISRVIKNIYLKYPKSMHVSYSTLVELLKVTVGKDDGWKLYKKTVKKIYNLPISDVEILYQQAFEFARQSRYRNAIEQCEKDINNQQYDTVHSRISELRSFGSEKDIGLDYWEDMGSRTRWRTDRYGVVPTRFKKLDKKMEGGLGAGELGIILAGGKVGKTTALANIAAGALWQMKTVAVASGELSAKKYRRRIDAIVSGIASKQLMKRHDEVFKKLENAHRMMKGGLYIKQFPSGKGSVGDIEVWLSDLEEMDKKVDLLIVDYLFLFNPNSRQRDKRNSIGQTAVELRGLGVEKMIPVWTASQGNRAALSKSVLGPKDFAEDISQFWTLDFLIALCQTKHEESYGKENKRPERARLVVASARDVGSGGIIKIEVDRETYRMKESDKDWEPEGSDEVQSEEEHKKLGKTIGNYGSND